MISKTRSIRLSETFAEAAQLRAQQLGYETWGDWVWSLMVYDMEVQGPHNVTLKLVNKLSRTERDALEEELLERTKNGVGKRGQFFAKFLEKHGLVEKKADV